MIKFYAYYSCGGYKDMYLANSEMLIDYTYYLPLLPIWQSAENLKPKDAERLTESKNLTMIQLITSERNWGFPKEAELFFSHGAYRAIYRSLDTEGSCLGLTGLDNGENDEFGRSIPFCMVITADKSDTGRLDALALMCIKKPKEMWKAIGKLLCYSPEMNGLRFNLNAANSIIQNAFKENNGMLEHHSGKINYLLIPSLLDLDKALKEQQLNRNFIDFVCTLQGESEGGLRYKSTVSILEMSNTETEVKRIEETHDIDNIAEIVAERVEQISAQHIKQVNVTIASLLSKVEQLSSTVISNETSEPTEPHEHSIKSSIPWLFIALCVLCVLNFAILIILLLK